MGLFDFVTSAAQSAVSITPALSVAAKAVLPPQLHAGFDAATNVLSKPTTASALTAVRNAIPPAAKQGFDTALALAIGKAKGPPAPAHLTPAGVVAFHVTQGLAGQGNPPAQNVAILKTFTLHPEAKVGAATAVAAIQANEGWWSRLLRAIGFKK